MRKTNATRHHYRLAPPLTYFIPHNTIGRERKFLFTRTTVRLSDS